MNIADVVKKQTDRILRQQRMNGTGAKIITGNPLGDPVVTQPLNETTHDALDHTGLTGVPAAEAFTEAAHATTDHTGITGCGGGGTDAESILTKPIMITNFTGKDGYVLAYNETLGEFYLKADNGGGSDWGTYGFVDAEPAISTIDIP